MSNSYTDFHKDCKADWHKKYGGCYMCCSACNYDQHRCHFCGEDLTHDSKESNGTRHWLSDCRPDLIADGTYKDGPMV